MPGKYDIEGYGTYEIDSDDDAEIQSTIAEIIAHEKAARASRPTLGGPTGLASKRLAALGGKPESEKGDFAPQPTPIAGNAIPAIEPVIAHAIGAAGQNPISSTLPGDLAGDGVRKYVPEEWYQAPKKDIRPEARRRYAALTDQVAPLEEGPETPKFIERHSRAMTAAIPETSAAPSAGGRFLRALDEHIAEMNPTNPAKPSDMLKAPGQLAEALNDYTDNAALLPISKLAGYLPDDPTWIPGAPAIQALANTRFGRGAVRGSGVNVGEGPISYKQGIEAALKVPEGFSRAGDVATLGAMGLPVVGPAILAGMIPEQIGHAGSDLGEIAGGLIGGDPEGAGMRAPGAAVNAGMLGLMGAHGLKSLEQGRMAEAAAKEQAAMAATERAAAPWYSQDFRAPEDVMAAARGDAHPLQQIRRGEYAPPPQPPPFVSGPEGQAQGPFPVPPDVQAQAGAPPADLRARTGNAPRPAPPPVDPATLLGRILENPQAPETPMRPTNPAVGDVPSWQDRQRAERGRRANPLEDPAKLKEILSNLLGPEPPQELEARTGRTPPAAEKIQVEPKATTDAQLEMVDEGQGQPGKKPGVLYTVQGGAKPPDVVPEGLARVDGPAGTLIFDPTKVTPEQAREALTSGEGLDKALGFSGPRPEPHPDNAVVSVLGKDGVEKSSQVAGPGDVEGAVKAAQGMAGEGDQVAVRTPDEVIADRQAGIEAEKKPPLDLKGIPAKVREHADGNVAAAGDSRVVTLRGDRGDAFVVHESANEPGAWQLTHLDKDGSPSGHRLFKSREDAIRSASGQVVRGDPSSVGSGYKVERRVEDKGAVGRPALPKNDDVRTPAAAKFTVEPTTEIEFADGWWYPEGRKRSDSHPTGETRTRWYLYEDGENVGKYDSAHEANFAIKERQRLAPPGASRTEAVEAAPKGDAPPEPGVRPAAEVAPRRIPWRHSTDGMEVVPVEELKFDNGGWAQATGAPANAKWTGEKRTVGYAWKNRDGITVGKRYATEAEAKAALAGAKAKAEIEAREYQEANPVPEPDLRTVTRGDLNELVADPSFPPGEARARAEKPDEPVRYTHAEVQSEQLPVTREQRHAAGGRPIRGPVMKHVVLWGPDGQIVEKRPMGIGPLAVRRANKIVKELNERPAGGGILEQPEVPAEPPRDTQPTPAPAAEPVAPGARKALLDERAASIEERRELQRKIREDSLSPKKLARAKEELRETELHLKALDKKLGYKAGGPTAAQVEADLKERFGDRYEPEAPEPVEAPAAEMPKGKPARVWVSPTEPLDVEYKIVEADTVRTSHDKRTGEPTPGFPQRKQPRDRSRESYLRQQAEIGQRPNPDLLLEGPEASVGAPITSEPGPEGIRDAEHGNGRTNGIRIAYEDGNAGEYRQRLIDDAARYGTTPEAVAGMREPMLIRERKTDLSAKEQVAIAKESNKGTAERMGTAEQAAVDAGAMTPELLSQFAPSESGDIMAASNRPFLRGFFSEIADSGDMVDRAGNVSAAGVARVKAAILAKAYGETSVLERALEAADDNTRNVSAGLLSAAPRVAKVRAMAESGELHPVDFTTPIKEAVDHLAHARAEQGGMQPASLPTPSDVKLGLARRLAAQRGADVGRAPAQPPPGAPGPAEPPPAGPAPTEVAAEPVGRPAVAPAEAPSGRGTLKEPWGDTNYLRPLGDLTDKLYHETSVGSALEAIPGVSISAHPGERFLSNDPDIATGQGGNKGVLLEFAPGDIRGIVAKGKPAARLSYDNGSAEFLAKHTEQAQFQDALRAVTVKKTALAQPGERRLMKNNLARLEKEGWTKTVNPDGSTTWRRPAVEPRSERLAPEPKEQLDAQLAAVGDGSKPGVFYPVQNGHEVPDTPPGLARVDGEQGSLIFDPKRVPVEKAQRAVDTGENLHEVNYLDQQDLFGDQISPEGRDVLSFLDKNKRSPKKIAGFIDSLARAVEAAGHPDQTDLFGGAPDAPSRAETFASAKRIYESRFESEGTQTGLFDQTGSGGPDRGAGPGAAPGGGGGAPGGGRPGGGEPGVYGSPSRSRRALARSRAGGAEATLEPEPVRPGGPAPEATVRPDVEPGDGVYEAPTSAPRAATMTGPGKKAETNPRQIIKELERITGTPIRYNFGHFAQRGAEGWFNRETNAIRMKQAEDLVTGAHEAGHSLHTFALKDQQHFPAAVSIELTRLGRDLYGPKPPNSGYIREGMAEYVAKYLIGDDMTKDAPAVHSWVRSNMPAEKLKALDAARELYEKWDVAGSVGQVKGKMVDADTSFVSRMKDGLDKLVRMAAPKMWTNKFSGLDEAMREVTDQLGLTEVHPMQDVARLAAALEKNATGSAYAAVTEGVPDLAGKKAGAGLKDALDKIGFKRLEDFAAYAYARRAVDLWERRAYDPDTKKRTGDPTPINPGISLRVAKHAVQQLESPEFRDALDKVTEWSNHLIDYVVKSGGLTPEEAVIIREANPVYVPLKRFFEESVQRGERGGGGGLKRIKGSGRSVLNPVYSLVEHAATMIRLGDRLRVARAVADLVDPVNVGQSGTKGYGGLAWFAEKIQAPKDSTSFGVADIKKQLEAAGADLTGADLGRVLTVFQNAKEYHGKQNIISIVRNGTREFYEVDPRVYEVLMRTEPHAVNPVMQALQAAKRGVQLGATGLNAGFSLVSNVLRDMPTSSIYSKSPGLVTPIDTFKAVWKEIRKSPEAQRWERGGGSMSTLIGQDRLASRRIIEEMLAKTPTEKGWVTFKHPVDALRKGLGIFESGPRIAEYERMLKVYEQKYGVDSEAAHLMAMLASKDVTVNFTRAGIVSEAINRIVPFFNARIQGASKFYRTFGGDYLESRGTARQPDAGKAALAATAKAMAWITVPTFALWVANKDEEWYQELPAWQKGAFWVWSPDHGKTKYRIPKPMELGWVFGSLPEAAWDYAYRQNKRGVMDALAGTVNSLMPIDVTRGASSLADLIPAGAKPLLEFGINYDAFRNRPIVDPFLERRKLPKDQYQRQTSETAKKLGEWLNISPSKIDHLAGGLTGGLAIDAVKAMELAVGARKAGSIEGLYDVPVLNRLALRPAPGASVDHMHEQDALLRQKVGSKVATEEEKATLKRIAAAKTAIDHARLAAEGAKGDDLHALNTWSTHMAQWALGKRAEMPEEELEALEEKFPSEEWGKAAKGDAAEDP